MSRLRIRRRHNRRSGLLLCLLGRRRQILVPCPAMDRKRASFLELGLVFLVLSPPQEEEYSEEGEDDAGGDADSEAGFGAG